MKGDEARKAAIAGIARVVGEHGYDGINIDFEIVKAAGRDYQAEREGLQSFGGGAQARAGLQASGWISGSCLLSSRLYTWRRYMTRRCLSELQTGWLS